MKKIQKHSEKIKETKGRKLKSAGSVFIITGLAIIFALSVYTFILQSGYTKTAIETEIARDTASADAGMIVTRARDGLEAVNLFKNHMQGTYDVILMDIMMPNMDGHQAARAIREMAEERPDASTIPIIALSANAFAEDIKASLDSGMNGHISKPFSMEEVTNTISKYIKS